MQSRKEHVKIIEFKSILLWIQILALSLIAYVIFAYTQTLRVSVSSCSSQWWWLPSVSISALFQAPVRIAFLV